MRQVQAEYSGRGPPVNFVTHGTASAALRPAPSWFGLNSRPPATTPTMPDPNAYWARNLRYLSILLSVWFVVSYGFGILFADALNAIRIPGHGLQAGVLVRATGVDLRLRGADLRLRPPDEPAGQGVRGGGGMRGRPLFLHLASPVPTARFGGPTQR